MAVTPTPCFTQSPLLTTVQVTAANTARDGTGTLSAGVAAGANGTLIDYVLFTGTATNAAGVLRIFIFDGTNSRLIAEILTTATTPSGTVLVATYTWTPPGNVPLPLPSGSSLKFSTHLAETWNCTVAGGIL